jgi:hypothetical protein
MAVAYGRQLYMSVSSDALQCSMRYRQCQNERTWDCFLKFCGRCVSDMVLAACSLLLLPDHLDVAA